MKWAVLFVVLWAASCKKDSQTPAPTTGSDKPVMTVAEVKRNRDACQDYVAKICACAEKVADLKQPCELAKAYPDAMETALETAANTESTRRDALQAHDAIRKIVKTCIEETARLPGLGCP
jgi:hypothetical protein